MALDDIELARRVAADIPQGAYVNLGIGMPVRIGEVLSPDQQVMLHSENGVLGFGPAPAPGQHDPELINASKGFVTLRPGASFFEQCDSFAMMRGGHLDIAVLGALEVSCNGDLANWRTNDDASRAPAVGGAMDLAAGARQIFVMTRHTTREGAPKLVAQCSYPLTGLGVVDRIYTDKCVCLPCGDGFRLVGMAPGVTLEELRACTGAPLIT